MLRREYIAIFAIIVATALQFGLAHHSVLSVHGTEPDVAMGRVARWSQCTLGIDGVKYYVVRRDLVRGGIHAIIPAEMVEMRGKPSSTVLMNEIKSRGGLVPTIHPFRWPKHVTPTTPGVDAYQWTATIHHDVPVRDLSEHEKSMLARHLIRGSEYQEVLLIGWPLRAWVLQCDATLEKMRDAAPASYRDPFVTINAVKYSHNYPRYLSYKYPLRLEPLQFIINSSFWAACVVVLIWCMLCISSVVRQLGKGCPVCRYPRVAGAAACSECGFRGFRAAAPVVGIVGR